MQNDEPQYPTQFPQSVDPLSEVSKAIQLRNAMGNLNKMQGGSPTNGVVNGMAAQPYNTGE